jgi:glycosyltransferase involved in cell wall biosynthesis
MKDKLLDFINKLEEKDSKFYFYVPDSSGNILASVEYVYDVAKVALDLGYKSIIFHEKDEYVIPPIDPTKYENIDIVSFKELSKKYTMSPIDFIFIGEQYVNGFLPQIRESKISSTVIVISQLQDFIFKNLNINESWDITHNIQNVLTTTVEQAKYIKMHMPILDIDVVNPIIDSVFNKSDKPAKPFVAILSRFAHDAEKIYKQFVLRFPMYSWIPFKTFGQMSKENLANELKECMCAVWHDEPSSFGTFPLECMRSGVPVIGLIPNVIPEWLVEDDKIAKNGTWVTSHLDLTSALVNVIDGILHNENLDEISKDNSHYATQYSQEKFTSDITNFVGKITINKIKQLKKLYEKQ